MSEKIKIDIREISDLLDVNFDVLKYYLIFKNVHGNINRPKILTKNNFVKLICIIDEGIALNFKIDKTILIDKFKTQFYLKKNEIEESISLILNQISENQEKLIDCSISEKCINSINSNDALKVEIYKQNESLKDNIIQLKNLIIDLENKTDLLENDVNNLKLLNPISTKNAIKKQKILNQFIKGYQRCNLTIFDTTNRLKTHENFAPILSKSKESKAVKKSQKGWFKGKEYYDSTTNSIRAVLIPTGGKNK